MAPAHICAAVELVVVAAAAVFGAGDWSRRLLLTVAIVVRSQVGENCERLRRVAGGATARSSHLLRRRRRARRRARAARKLRKTFVCRLHSTSPVVLFKSLNVGSMVVHFIFWSRNLNLASCTRIDTWLSEWTWLLSRTKQQVATRLLLGVMVQTFRSVTSKTSGLIDLSCLSRLPRSTPSGALWSRILPAFFTVRCC